jgi:hypothetical protein
MKGELALDCDILVAGGGAAGVPCALAAARNGAKVILCQDRPVLGGNASSEIRLNIMGADVFGRRGVPLETEAREGGILEEIRLEAAYRNPQLSPTFWDLILYEKCYQEPNLRLMLNTVVDGTEVFNKRINSAHASRASTEDNFKISAKIFIDCTGDGRLGVEAGACFHEGREPESQYGESLAPPTGDNFRLGSTLLFQARDMRRPVPFVPPQFARKFSETDLVFRSHKSLEYGYWWIEWGGKQDTIKDNEEIKHELLSILMGVWDHIKNGGDHDAENWALTWFGWVPGKRESRRFLGQYVLTQTDLEGAVSFPDSIAYGGWALDTHPPEGIDFQDGFPGTDVAAEYVQYLYEIPLRVCVSRDIENLMFAGRNISASHIAFSSTRVMGTCGVVGQGVGTAAALGIIHGIDPTAMAGNKVFIHRIQQQLLLDDCFIPGVKHDDPEDLAVAAKIIASSFIEGGEPRNLISGETRAVHGSQGVKPGMTVASTHRWMSEPARGFPAWIELEWESPKAIDWIQIIFDTGLHRPLTQTYMDDFYGSDLIWGPQPETVKEFSLAYAPTDGATLVNLIEETNNYQRRRVYSFQAVSIKRLRLTIEDTWGITQGRVCEIRCYSK